MDYLKIYLAAAAAEHKRANLGRALGSTLKGLAGAAGHLGGKAMRFANKIPAGEKIFSKPMHYVTRPLRTALFPNLGRPLNVARLGVTGYMGAKAVGTMSDAYSKMSDTAGNLASKVREGHLNVGLTPEEIKSRYGTLSGMAGVWARQGPLRSIFGGDTSGMKEWAVDQLDGLAYDTGKSYISQRFSDASRGGIKPYEWAQGPVIPLLRQAALDAGGDENAEAHLRERVLERFRKAQAEFVARNARQQGGAR